MKYLHSKGIIHRDLKPANILMDQSLNPKIADFGFTKLMDKITESMNLQSKSGIKGTPIYISPEIFKYEQYTQACDVYAFAIIVYQIIVNKVPFNCNQYVLMRKITSGERPEFTDDIPECYKVFIECCWEQMPEDRPTFEQIVDVLKNNSGFITENIDEDEFLDYVEKVDNYESNFKMKDSSIHLNTFLSTDNIQKPVKIIEDIPIENNENEDKVIEEKITGDKIIEDDKEPLSNIKKVVYPSEELSKLPNECQLLVKEAECDPEKQLIVGKKLMRGDENFQLNKPLGIEYLQASISNGCLESALYLANVYINTNDTQEAREILNQFHDDKNSELLYLLGSIERKEENYEKAIQYFKKSIELGNCNAMHSYGLMLHFGEGMPFDRVKSYEYFDMTKKNGCLKNTPAKSIKLDRSKIPLNIEKAITESQQTISLKKEITNSPPVLRHSLKMTPQQMLIVSSMRLSFVLRFQLVGDANSSKHSLLYCLKNDEHWGEYLPSIISENEVHEFLYRGEKINIYMDDSYGRERYNFRKLYYPYANVFIMVYSFDNRESLNNLVRKWKNDIDEYRKNAFVVLVRINDPYEKSSQIIPQSDVQEAIDIINPNMIQYVTCSNIEEVYNLKKKIIDDYIDYFYKIPVPLSSNKKKFKKTKNIKTLLVGDIHCGQYYLINYINGVDLHSGFHELNRIEKSI